MTTVSDAMAMALLASPLVFQFFCFCGFFAAFLVVHNFGECRFVVAFVTFGCMVCFSQEVKGGGGGSGEMMHVTVMLVPFPSVMCYSVVQVYSASCLGNTHP